MAELDGANNLISRFVYGARTNVPSYIVKGGTTYRIVSDHLGSVRMVVNVATGVIAQRIDYDEFGRVLSDSSPGFQPLGFAGGLWESDTGLVRFGARDYDPMTGRWTTKDALRFGGGLNFYTYANNDSVNFIDPDGRFPLPADPSGLGPEWIPDPNFDPFGRSNSQRFLHKSGDWLRFDRADPTKPGWRKIDHWHHSSDPDKHLKPGVDVPDPPNMCQLNVPGDPGWNDMWDDSKNANSEYFGGIPILPFPLPPAWAPVTSWGSVLEWAL